MSHHDRRVQRTEIQGCNGNVVEALLGLDNCSSEPSTRVQRHREVPNGCHTFAVEVRDDVILFVGFPVQLRQHFDGLASREEVIERYARHTRHLSAVDETRELVHEALR